MGRDEHDPRGGAVVWLVIGLLLWAIGIAVWVHHG
jgi:hypothetical protein